MLRLACALSATAAVMAVPIATDDASSSAASIPLTTFDGNKATTQNWRATNDPVMGGISQSSVKVADGALSWTGEVKVVPKLHAPGFCTATTGGYEQPKDHFPDLSSTEGLLVTVRNKLSGGLSSFKVNMDTGAGRSGQFEARFNTTVSSNFKTFFVPFTSMTSDYRGRPEGGAPTKAQLGAITGLGLNQDGLAGKFDIELKSITAGSPGGGGGGGGKTLDLVTFAEGDKTNYKWTDLNDPVMGGRSTSTFKVEAGKGVFSGVCRIVPALKAPGFCNAEARPALGQKIADASAFIDGGLEIVLTSTGNLTQFKAAFGNKAEHDFGSFKADFTVTKGPNTVRIPFTSFSNKWSSSTGEPTVKCSPENKRVCPTARSLSTIGAVGVWAEGYAGVFHLELTAIRAYLGGGGGGSVCHASEFCCPDARHCLTPVPGKTCGNAAPCASGETCCPLTKICVNVGAACKSPCADQGSYCCPDARHCLTPVNPGHLCDPSDKKACRTGDVCCPLIKECVSVGAACTPSDDAPDWIV